MSSRFASIDRLMQITVKVRYRSKRRIAANQQEATTGLSPWIHSTDRASPGEPFVSNAHDRQNASKVDDLNNLSDPPKKFIEPAGDTPSPVPPDTCRGEKPIALNDVPVEILQLAPGSRIIMHTDPNSAGADRFRFLRMCLRELWNTGKLKTLQITSPLAQDGKSTIALNLATALAEGGKRKVLLLEADLHRPTLSDQLGIEQRAGLADCLEGSLQPGAALRRLEPLGWYLLPAGEASSHPTELLQTDALAGVLQKVSPLFDWILIDCPPVTPLTDALSIARQADATLLVAREGHTPREAIDKTIAILGRQRVLGVVLNAVENIDRLYSGYYGYHGTKARIPLKQPAMLKLSERRLTGDHSDPKTPE